MKMKTLHSIPTCGKWLSEKLISAFWMILFGLGVSAQPGGSAVSKTWVSDQGDGTFKNPVLHADYSDPDLVRVGDDYFMTASSFNCVPGLPILHSKDLVNWQLIGHALYRQPPYDFFDKPQHGCGVWAPCLRYHNGEFWIFYPDPDHGIYMTKAKNPAGPWSEPHLVAGGKGLIDPSPLWDDDGRAYLVYAFAGSRAGIKSVLMVDRMSPDGTYLFGQPVMVFDGSKEHPTVEGPKFSKRNGWYYIFAPAGGVTNGWQLVLRSRNIFGPYEEKVVMAQGSTDINGPHQGGWVNTPSGEFWFLHFQDKGPYGRVVHLNPMQWINDWPIIGHDKNGDGCGEPVSLWKKPNVGRTFALKTPPESDDFSNTSLALQWQWHANPQITWGFPSGNLGFYRLNCIPKPEEFKNLWTVPNLLMQKFPAPAFTATTKLTFHARFDGEEVGFVVMGLDYQYISLKRADGKLKVKVARCLQADRGSNEEVLFSEDYNGQDIFFRMEVQDGGICRFSYSADETTFVQAGTEFQSKQGRWIGSKFGYFALRDGVINDAGTADLHHIEIR
jgi:beta-xylosidase